MRPDFLARINAVRVTADELIAAQDDIGRLAIDGHDLEGASAAIAERHRDDREPLKAAAVMFRLEALQRLVESGGAAGFVEEPTPDGWRQASRAAFAAAARCRLLARHGASYFDAAEFRRRAMETVEIEGHA